MPALSERVDSHGMPITTPALPNDEDGVIDLVQDQDYIDVVFAEEKTDLLYPLDATVEYPNDPPPDKLWVTTVVKSLGGCRAYLNAGPSDGLFNLKWRVRA